MTAALGTLGKSQVKFLELAPRKERSRIEGHIPPLRAELEVHTLPIGQADPLIQLPTLFFQ